MSFLTEPEPARGVALPVLPGVSRIVAPNAGPMTYHGTNTWLIDGADGISVLDPGPDSAPHVAAILAATGGVIARILVSHTHRDHVGAVAAVRDATGAAVAAHGESRIDGKAPDIALRDGDVIAGLAVLHTPGHASDHLCFSARTQSGRLLFTGDHVMSWSSSVVSPPDGDMAAYLSSLRRLLARADDDVYLCGHGPMLERPLRLVRALLELRLVREAAILSALAASPAELPRLTATLYARVAPELRRPAERVVLAHLLKLQAEGRASQDGETWRATCAGVSQTT